MIGCGVFAHWWRTGETAPYTSFITVSVGGVLLGVLLAAVAMLAGLIARLKLQVEGAARLAAAARLFLTPLSRE
jgi:hypothetical protein